MGRRFRGWGGGSLSQLQGARKKNGTGGEKGLVCVEMESTGADLHTDAGLREELKHKIQGLSDESIKKLWEAIQGGAFGALRETGNQVVGFP